MTSGRDEMLSNVTNLMTVRNDERRVEILNILEAMINTIKDAESVSDMTVLIKVDGDYVRFASSTDDVMATIAQLELAKFDALRRMMQ
jgi:hypothetical protein